MLVLHFLAAALAPHPLLRAALPMGARSTRCCASAVAELQASLLSELASTPQRGAEASDAEASSLLGLIDQLEPLDPSARDGWENSDDLTDGTWRLEYTSSRTYWDNDGLTGYYTAAQVASGATPGTPELLLRFTSSKGAKGTLEFEERPLYAARGSNPGPAACS